MSRWWGIALTWCYFALSAFDVCLAISKYVHHDDLWPIWAFFATYFLYYGIQRLIRQEVKRGPVAIKLNGQTLADVVRKYDPNA